jgi:nitrilase
MHATDHRVAIVQHPPVLLDKAGTLARAVQLVDEAVAGGARLIVLPETFVPGYPEWIWRVAPSDALNGAAFARLQENAVDLASDDLQPLQEAARRHGVTIVCGIHERDGSFSRGTLYNTVVIVGPDGSILNRHRKLMPTNPERMVWGQGDGSGLCVVDTPAGRVGSLICWENYMPLARFALYAQGVEIYVAPTWDEGETWVASMRHIAAEGRCWVLGSANCIQAKDIPLDFPSRADLYPDEAEWLNPGDSVIVNPTGTIVAGPLHEAYGILYADCDPAKARAAKRTLDTAGHYGRPDVFSLSVNRSASIPATFIDDGTPHRVAEAVPRERGR